MVDRKYNAINWQNHNDKHLTTEELTEIRRRLAGLHFSQEVFEDDPITKQLFYIASALNRELLLKEKKELLNKGGIDFTSLSYEEFSRCLRDCNIPLDLWGMGVAKTVSDLRNEIIAGESVLTIDALGNLIRSVNVTWLDVIYIDGDTIYILKEDRQEYSDGRIRQRNLSTSLGEKMLPYETPHEAAYRALSEEIGVTSVEGLYTIGSSKTIHTPDAYPGLISNYVNESYVAVIGEQDFNPDGYIERQESKTNYYVWQKLR
jgi:hypothetical protein